MGDMKEFLRMMADVIDAKKKVNEKLSKEKEDDEIRKALQEFSAEMDSISSDSPDRRLAREIMGRKDPWAWELGYNDIQEKLNGLNKEINEKMMDLLVDMIKERKPGIKLDELVDIASKVCGTLQYVSFILECIHGPVVECIKKQGEKRPKYKDKVEMSGGHLLVPKCFGEYLDEESKQCNNIDCEYRMLCRKNYERHE